jgi:nucleoside-diphosphate-sugar epimerase
MTGTYWQDKKVLVAGGAGFIGSYLVDLLVAEKARVTVADDLSRGSMANLSDVMDKITFRNVDLRYLQQCEDVCAGQDVVMALAAPAFGIEYSMTHHGEMLTDVIRIAFNLLDAARQHNVRRFLVVSSSCVYPDNAGVPTREEEGDRDLPEIVNLGYGWGKRMVEMQGQYYAKEYGMEVAIGRPFNGYGPRDPYEAEKAHVIPALIKRVLDGDDPLVVWGSGNQSRSFVHGKDLARGLMLLTEHYAVADPVNIGHDRETSIRELIERILAITGREAKVVFDTDKPEGAARKSADTTKLRKATQGFTPEITLDQGLEEMVECFREKYFEQ